MKMREIPPCVVFRLGNKYESFTLRGGLYIPFSGLSTQDIKYFRRDLDTVLRNWIKQEGMMKGETNDRYANAIRSRIYGDQSLQESIDQNE